MSVIKISIGKSLYEIKCNDNEDNKIKNIAKKLNERVNKTYMKVKNNNLDEKYILMLTALFMEEEILKDTQANLEKNDTNHIEQEISQEEIISLMNKINNWSKNLLEQIK